MSNIWIAASDGNIPLVLSHLSTNPSLVNTPDSYGYTPIHAAASYSHLPLLRLLITSHSGNVNLPDPDGDTPLFTSETVEVAKCLVEELHADWRWRNSEGLTAAESIEEGGEFPLVAAYLRSLEEETSVQNDSGIENDANIGSSSRMGGSNGTINDPPPGVSVQIRSIDESARGDGSSALEERPVVDEEFKRRIEELASKPPGEVGDGELKDLVTEAVRNHVFASLSTEDEERSVRRR